MIVLGIDPGLSMAGWGVVSKGSLDKVTPLGYGCIKTFPGTCLAERLRFLFTETQSIINKYKPEAVAMEKIFFRTGSSVIATIGQARGALISAVAVNNIPLFEYNPRSIKKALTGYGSADKYQMQHMVKSVLGLKEIPQPDDAADALAMAICHINTGDLERFDSKSISGGAGGVLAKIAQKDGGVNPKTKLEALIKAALKAQK